MMQAWLLILPTFCRLQLKLVGAAAAGSGPINLSFDKHSTPVRIGSPNPFGLSLEFVDFPSYMTAVVQTNQCLLNLEAANGVAPPIRIGGTTQDRATYDPNQKDPVLFVMPPGKKVAQKVTFGPAFIDLASRLKGATTLGLNRQQGDKNNAGLAALAAVQKMKNLYALELGNEPNCAARHFVVISFFSKQKRIEKLILGTHFANSPTVLCLSVWDPQSPEVGGKPWTPEADAASQIQWQQAISQQVKLSSIIQAGVFFSPAPFSVQNLAPKEGNSLQFVKSFGGHSYPQSACGNSQTSLPDLVNHAKVVSFVKQYQPEVLAAKSVKKPYFFSESNSAICGGSPTISATFGAGLWSMDFMFQSLLLGVDGVFFHLRNNGPYSFWNQTLVSPTYYGAYFSTLALREATHISTLETSNPDVVLYAFFRCQRAVRLVVYHSGFLDGKAAAEPAPVTVKIDRLPSDVKKVRLLRLTAKNSFIGQGGPGAGQVQIGGGYFDNATCKITAQPKYETLTSTGNRLEFPIRKSQAVMIELDRQIPKKC
ncbi:hypothetical protein MJO28_013889 [Puccinia striiformis f. sp. tritici]|uniref:Uncharacterized protein n=1 Tax=Puccinia striiformis f. sp. tritici TaxID=168172 RepID=A0ACC0DXH1_9BASI|nr:hypothetical protein MJO28_013889 [Puccinia striiformis f. sp. tritici]